MKKQSIIRRSTFFLWSMLVMRIAYSAMLTFAGQKDRVNGEFIPTGVHITPTAAKTPRFKR